MAKHAGCACRPELGPAAQYPPGTITASMQDTPAGEPAPARVDPKGCPTARRCFTDATIGPNSFHTTVNHQPHCTHARRATRGLTRSTSKAGTVPAEPTCRGHTHTRGTSGRQRPTANRQPPRHARATHEPPPHLLLRSPLAFLIVLAEVRRPARDLKLLQPHLPRSTLPPPPPPAAAAVARRDARRHRGAAHTGARQCREVSAWL